MPDFDWRQMAHLRRQALEAALQDLTPDERAAVEWAIETLRQELRRRRPGGTFGRLTMMEIVAAVGRLLDESAGGDDGLSDRK